LCISAGVPVEIPLRGAVNVLSGPVDGVTGVFPVGAYAEVPVLGLFRVVVGVPIASTKVCGGGAVVVGVQ
jgi:hypothetical protein